MNEQVKKNLAIYRKTIERDHKSKALRLYFLTYQFFWFHTQALWIKDPAARRPYTYLMRDWLYPHLFYFIIILLTWYAGLTAWLILSDGLAGRLASLYLGVLSGMLVAHLTWGSGWKPGEQEFPPYLGEDE